MYKTNDCPLCGGERHANNYAVLCHNPFCPLTSYPMEDQILWGWKNNPNYMKKHHKMWVKQWEEMGKDYDKWLLEYFRSRVGVGRCLTQS